MRLKEKLAILKAEIKFWIMKKLWPHYKCEDCFGGGGCFCASFGAYSPGDKSIKPKWVECGRYFFCWWFGKPNPPWRKKKSS